MHRKNHSSFFCYRSHKKKNPKTSPGRQPHKHLGPVRYNHTYWFFPHLLRKESSKAGPWHWCCFPSWCSSPRAPQIETAVYTAVCEHTLPIPLRARRANAQPAERKEKGTRGGEQKGSTSQPSSQRQLHWDQRSGREVAICSPSSHTAESSRPPLPATGTA